MADYPTRGEKPWDQHLKTYIDAGDTEAKAAAAAADAKATTADTKATNAGTAAAAADTKATNAGTAAAAADTKATNAAAAAAAAAVKQVQYVPNQLSRLVTTDTPTVTLGAAADGAYNEGYAVTGGALPAIWPIEAYGKMGILNGTWAALQPSGASTVTTFRFMTDGDAFALSVYAAAGGFQMSLFVDGRSFPANPYTPAVTSGFGNFGLQTVVFNSGAKPEGRLIEIRMVNGLAGVYVKKPYRVWKPPVPRNPKIAVVGDSYTLPTVMNDASAGNVAVGGYDAGIYQQMNENLGVSPLTVDGIGGSGFIATGTAGMQYGHANRLQWLIDINPDVVIVHGGGANDLNSGNTVAQVIAAAVAYFTSLRAALPQAKLVFVEGFAPPLFTPGTFNPNYTAVRQGVQNALNAAGIKVYYLDIATTRPPLSGTGYVTNVKGDGNSDVYVGSDGVHLTVKGNKYGRAILAPKIAVVLADDGRLAGTLIL